MHDRLLDPIEVHSKLNRPLSKLELLSRLSPLLDSDREYAQCLSLIIDMMADYIGQVRAVVDGFVHTPSSESLE
jgi:hypothetical protein